jgi:hypothetical protein
MDTPPTQKKGLGPVAWISIGCGGIIVLGIIAVVIVGLVFGKKFADNPTKATASIIVTSGVGEMVAEDDVQKRYTIKEKKSGKLMTFYWSKKSNGPAQVDGDFSAIPPGDLGTPPNLKAPPTPAPAH